METKQLYLYDSYQKECTAIVQKVSGNQVILDQTVFHPLTGGVSYDTGYINKDKNAYSVVQVAINKDTKEIIHILDNAACLHADDVVSGILNWERRYKLMRLHTAAHLIAAIMYRDYNALITGGQVDPEQAKIDFNLPTTNREIFEDTITKANLEVNKGISLKIYFLERTEALKMPGIVKLAERMPPQVKEFRIVEIPGVDVQADGGPHVNNTREIGKIHLVKVENKGKTQRRVYFNVS
ncbi:MAG: alanyl-tRNA editing protein AlaXM [Candidatus Bathyarchaeia archaeon]